MGGVDRDEKRVVDGDIHRQTAPRNEPCKIGRLDVVGGDPGEHLGVDPPGIGFRELRQLGTEGVFGVPLRQIAVNLGQVIPLLEFRGERPFAGRHLTNADHVGPAPFPCQKRGLGGEIFVDLPKRHPCGGQQPDREQLKLQGTAAKKTADRG